MASSNVQLGFKAFDLHELLPHFVAQALGYYREASLDVHLRDITFLPGDQYPDNLFSTACGAALVSSLTGHSQKVVLVSTDFPLFWLCAHPQLTWPQGLLGQRVAGYPSVAPPAQFLGIILRREGLSPERDVQIEEVREDAARIGLLKSRQVAAAVISSTVPLPRLEERRLRPLLFFGDRLRIPTAGLAAPARVIQQNPGLVEKMVGVFQRSLRAIHRHRGPDRDRAVAVIKELLDVEPSTYDAVVPYFTREGRTSTEIARQGIRLMARELQVSDPVSVDTVYDWSFLTTAS
ncbi:MAG: ABC transporter substrate-binding protein [Acidobacteriota bacterium]